MVSRGHAQRLVDRRALAAPVVLERAAPLLHLRHLPFSSLFPHQAMLPVSKAQLLLASPHGFASYPMNKEHLPVCPGMP